MRILLTATASYDPPRGGATRSNLIWLNHLATAGHACRIVCGPGGEGARFERNPAIELFAVEEPARRTRELRRQIQEFNPDWVLVSSEDLGHALLREAHHAAPGRVVYLAHTPQFYPFGPASWNPEPNAAELVARSAGIVAIGRHMAAYIKESLGREAAVIHPPIYGDGPFENLACFGQGHVAMINPCAVKGISIFLAVAERMPAQQFAVTPGWGTTGEDRRAIAAVPNVRVLPNTPGIDELLRGTSVLMMPSLWYEGFGLIVMEAMLRGIPVVASDASGLKEAKQGTGYLIPVNSIERYQPAFDELGMPRPVAPEINPEPWVAALTTLLTDSNAYARESEISRHVASEFIRWLDAGDMASYLAALGRQAAPPVAAPAATATMESLSSEKRALLLQRLRKRQRGR